jgi:hypothetical protein
MNDVLNSQGYAQAAGGIGSRPRRGLDVCHGICANALVVLPRENLGLSGFSLWFPSLSFSSLISTLHAVVIKVVPQNLLSLSESLHAQSVRPSVRERAVQNASRTWTNGPTRTSDQSSVNSDRWTMTKEVTPGHALALLVSLMLPSVSAHAGAKGRSRNGQDGCSNEFPLTAEKVLANPEILHQRLKAKNPQYGGMRSSRTNRHLGLVGDPGHGNHGYFTPQGHTLRCTRLEGLQSPTFDPLRGMPLKALALEETKVIDLKPLKE